MLKTEIKKIKDAGKPLITKVGGVSLLRTDCNSRSTGTMGR